MAATIFDHLPQFSIIPNMFGNIPGNKWDRSESDRENFILDYVSVDWGDLLDNAKLNANNSTKTFLDKINKFSKFLDKALMHLLKELKNISINLSLNLG